MWTRTDKRQNSPYSVSGKATGTSQDHVAEWTDYDASMQALNRPNSEFDGIGFVMPKGVFLLDIDHMNEDDPVFISIRTMFLTYTEVSPSGQGHHIYGRADLSRIPCSWDEKENRWKLDDRYLVKNSSKGLEW